MKRFRLRDALVMLLPVAILAGMGFWMQGRKPAVLIAPRPPRPIPVSLYVKSVRFVPVTAEDVYDGYETKALVELDARGYKPEWWRKGFSTRHGRAKTGRLVKRRNSRIQPLARQAYLSAPMRRKDGRWEAEYKFKLLDIPAKAGEIRLQDKILIQDDNYSTRASLWLDMLVRTYGIATKVPHVSRTPLIKLERCSIEPRPPVQYEGFDEYLRVEWSFLKPSTRSGASQTPDPVSINMAVVDAKGKAYGSSSQAGVSYWMAVRNVGDSRREVLYLDYDCSPSRAKLPPSGPLYLQGEARWNKGWPLVFRIPLRDVKGTMLFTSRNVKPMFRVVSVKVQPVTSIYRSEPYKADPVFGNDTWVLVNLEMVEPINPWDWDADYSQHLDAADGTKIWRFPVKVGTMRSEPTCNTDGRTTTIAYPLTLNTIPQSKGKLIFKTEISANGCRRVPISVVVRP